MNKKNNHIVINTLCCFLFLGIAGCGWLDKKKDNSPEPAPDNVAESDNKKPDTAPGERPANGTELPKATDSANAERDCAAKGSDYSWTAGTCTLLPNKTLTGELSATPGRLWEVNTETCDKQNTTTGDRYYLCAAIDAALPLAVADQGKSKITIELEFECESLRPSSVDLALELGSPADDGEPMAATQSLGGGKSTFRQTIVAPRDARPVLKIKFNPAGNVFKPGCKIDLIENSAEAIAE